MTNWAEHTMSEASLSEEIPSKFWQRPENTDISFNTEGDITFGYEWSTDSLSNTSPDSENLCVQTKSAPKRRQTKMLLVALIESFCRMYGDSPPEANRKIFFLICQTLRSLGLIDSEFVDEMANVRSTFQNAFQKLFYTAVQTVRNQELHKPEQLMIGWFDGDQSRSLSDPSSPNSYSRTLSLSSDQLLFNLSVQNSRYRNDFVEINMIGKGGFASAWRARNRLDGIDYAIKKIRLGRDLDMSDQNPYEKVFREIKHLARLEHRNVIRYYSSWLEYSTMSSTEEDDGVEGSSRMTDDESSIFNGRDPTFDDTINPQSSPGIDFIADHSMDLACSSPSELTPPTKVASKTDRSSGMLSTTESEWILYIQMQICPATLHDYIKFRNQRCVENGNKVVDTKRNIEIFSQILEGTAYIHEQGLIHRDLKPSNIFLGMPMSLSEHRGSQSSVRRNGERSQASSFLGGHGSPGSAKSSHLHGLNHNHSFSFDSVLTANGLRSCMWDEAWVPKIGDFGLAAASATDDGMFPAIPVGPSSIPSQVSESPADSTLSTTSNSNSSSLMMRRSRPLLQRTRTSCVGTRTYASPEQMSNIPSVYNEKVDIYSLGIIFFELYQPFSTGMERAEAIENLKNGVFPEGFVERYPKESALILWMMDKDPAVRPSAMQMLEFELFSQPTDMYTSLQSQLQAKSIALDKKTKEMAALQMEMQRVEQEKKREMEDLQRRLEDLQHKLELAQISSNKQQTSPPLSPFCDGQPTNSE